MIQDIIQSKDGHLWMINAGELCKFDGKDFTYYPLKNDIEKKEYLKTELTELITGEFMFRSSVFVKFNPITESFTYYADPLKEATGIYSKKNEEEIGFFEPVSARFDKAGTVWYTNIKGVFKLFEDSCFNLLADSKKTIRPDASWSMIDNEGKSWMITEKDLYRMEKNNLKHENDVI